MLAGWPAQFAGGTPPAVANLYTSVMVDEEADLTVKCSHATAEEIGALEALIFLHATAPRLLLAVSRLKKGVVTSSKKCTPLTIMFAFEPTTSMAGRGRLAAIWGSSATSSGNCAAGQVTLKSVARAPIWTGMLFAVESAHV
jgi:hypothetical protein